MSDVARGVVVLSVLLGAGAWAQDPPLVSADPLPPEVPMLTDPRIEPTMLAAQIDVEQCYFGRGKKQKGDALLKLDFSLTAEGQVRDARVDVEGSTLTNLELHACAVRVVSALAFPAGPAITTSWTFTLGRAQRVGDTVHLTYRGGDVPAGFHLATEPNWKMLAPALAVLGAGYLVSTITGLLTLHPISAVPLVGPLLWVGEVWSTSGVFSPIGNFLAVFWGGIEFAAQAVGTVLLIVGLSTPRKVLERDAAPRVTFAPGAPGSPLGATVVGRF